MKRDMELIRKILFAVENEEKDNPIEGYSENVLRYHQALLIEAGLLEGKVLHGNVTFSESPVSVLIKKLTWEGHELLAAVRRDSIWNTIKSDFQEASVETIIKVAKQLAEGWAKKKVELLLEGDS
ncbi:MAG: DUF2513 domain-containing protein [Gammaproteobacteria bacterium]|nr:DUF2513 domain-containing protein [Gammaproteobacteria bacterium]